MREKKKYLYFDREERKLLVLKKYKALQADDNQIWGGVVRNKL